MRMMKRKTKKFLVCFWAVYLLFVLSLSVFASMDLKLANGVRVDTSTVVTNESGKFKITSAAIVADHGSYMGYDVSIQFSLMRDTSDGMPSVLVACLDSEGNVLKQSSLRGSYLGENQGTILNIPVETTCIRLM